jgi:hypothetical protein
MASMGLAKCSIGSLAAPDGSGGTSDDKKTAVSRKAWRRI